VLTALTLLGLGCGKGLTVNLTADPNPAAPGQSVTWTVTVRNDTQCETITAPDPLPSPIPTTDVGALFVGFDPTIGPGEAESFCSSLMASSCRDERCLFTMFEAQFGPAFAQALSDRAHAAMEAHEPQAANTCITLANNSDGFAGFCSFDPLSPGETGTAMHTDTAPNTGNTNPAQFAVAFAAAEGSDCRPGTNVEDDFWVLTGCFPVGPTQAAPVLSPLAVSVVALLLLAGGVFGIRRGSHKR
jgi:hypothetical protein